MLWNILLIQSIICEELSLSAHIWAVELIWTGGKSSSVWCPLMVERDVLSELDTPGSFVPAQCTGPRGKGGAAPAVHLDISHWFSSPWSHHINPIIRPSSVLLGIPIPLPRGHLGSCKVDGFGEWLEEKVCKSVTCNSPRCLKNKKVHLACWRRLHNCLVTSDLILNSPQKHQSKHDSRTSNIFRRPMVTIALRKPRLRWSVFSVCYLLERAPARSPPSTSLTLDPILPAPPSF